MRAVTLAALAWGVLAFGAVYPWAYVPMLALCGVAGLLGLVRGRGRVDAAIAAGLAVVSGAVLLQLVPLPRGTLTAISPATVGLLDRYDFIYGARAGLGSNPSHALSIDPPRTWLALGFLVTLSIFLLGLASGTGRSSASALVRGVAALGGIVAVVAFAHDGAGEPAIYGFWVPQQGRNPFPPFVNRNHFAGWMLMAIPVSLGYLLGLVNRGMGEQTNWRSRLIWLSSRPASEAVLVAVAVGLMAVSLVMTMSRSGLTAFGLSMAIAAWVTISHQPRRSGRLAGLGIVIAIVALAVTWWGADTLVSRFASARGTGLNGRLAAWADAWRVVKDFRLGTGLNTYGVAMLFYQEHDLGLHYTAAHNDYLQLLAEGGIGLTLAVTLAIALFVGRVHRRFREAAHQGMTFWLRTGAMTGLVAIALQESADFSLQIPGNAALFATLCALALQASPGREGDRERRHVDHRAAPRG